MNPIIPHNTPSLPIPQITKNRGLLPTVFLLVKYVKCDYCITLQVLVVPSL